MTKKLKNHLANKKNNSQSKKSHQHRGKKLLGAWLVIAVVVIGGAFQFFSKITENQTKVLGVDWDKLLCKRF